MKFFIPFVYLFITTVSAQNNFTLTPITSEPVAANTTAPTVAPTTAPVEVVVNTTSPTEAPTVTESDEPTVTPTTTAPVTASPTTAPITGAPITSSPTKVKETKAPSTSAPISTSDTPSETPSDVPSDAPTIFFVSAQCSDHSNCAALNLTGVCCPTVDEWMLDCCDGPDIPVFQQCEQNPKCDALGLTNACCPTADEFWYLDCCEAVPDECLEEGACPIFSAVQYKLDLEAKEKNQASSAYTTMTVQLSTCMMVGMIMTFMIQ